MHVRRVVTGHDRSGKAIIANDSASPRERRLRHTPGFVASPLWKGPATPLLPDNAADPMTEGGSLLAAPGEAVFLVVTFPPDAVTMAGDFDPAAAGAEFADAIPGIAQTFEPEHPGMHRTPTVDFATVIKGPIVLEVDGGVTTVLHTGDTVVQRATRHAWRNPGNENAIVSFVMLGGAV